MLRNAIRRASNRQFGLTPPPSKSFVCAFCQHTPSRLLSTSASRLDDTRKPESALSMTIKEMMDPKKPKKEPKEKKEKAQSKKSRAHTERLKEKKAKAKENSLPKSPKKSQKKEGIIRKIVSATSSLAQQKKETAHREAAMKTPDSKDKASPVPQRRQGFSVIEPTTPVWGDKCLQSIEGKGDGRVDPRGNASPGHRYYRAGNWVVYEGNGN